MYYWLMYSKASATIKIQGPIFLDQINADLIGPLRKSILVGHPETDYPVRPFYDP